MTSDTKKVVLWNFITMIAADFSCGDKKLAQKVVQFLQKWGKIM